MDHLGIFAKHWQPGNVKTRLARSVGAATATHVYLALLCDLIYRLRKVGNSRAIAFSPADRQEEFARLQASASNGVLGTPPDLASADLNNETFWELTAQSAGDLGQRMSHFFQEAFRQGAQRVILIGSDCPEITPTLCHTAFEALKTQDVVLGPTEDGGYYLVGMAGAFVDVFSEITFSTSSVLIETTEKLKRHNTSHFLLPLLNDIDERDDLEKFVDLLEHRRQTNAASPTEVRLHKRLKQHLTDGAPS